MAGHGPRGGDQPPVDLDPDQRQPVQALGGHGDGLVERGVAAGAEPGHAGPVGGQGGVHPPPPGPQLALPVLAVAGHPGGRPDPLLLELVDGGHRLAGDHGRPALLARPGPVAPGAGHPGHPEQHRAGDRHRKQGEQLGADRQVSEHLRILRRNRDASKFREVRAVQA